MKNIWSIEVIYEDENTRKEAVRFCDEMMQKFWAENEFEIQWSSFGQLRDDSHARQAAERAKSARFVVLADEPTHLLPEIVELWFENWLAQRKDKEGFIVGLMDGTGHNPDIGRSKYTLLRNLAHRAGLDYLTCVPENLVAIPDSPDSCTQRARQVTNVLDEILRRPVLPKSLNS